MSKMKELYEKVSKDAALQSKLADILNNAEKLGETATKNKLVQFAKEEGYETTPEEIQAFFKNLADSNDTEMSDVELDMVAGGKRPNNIMLSITTFGFGCAVMTMVDAIRGSSNGGCRQ